MPRGNEVNGRPDYEPREGRPATQVVAVERIGEPPEAVRVWVAAPPAPEPEPEPEPLTTVTLDPVLVSVVTPPPTKPRGEEWPLPFLPDTGPPPPPPFLARLRFWQAKS